MIIDMNVTNFITIALIAIAANWAMERVKSKMKAGA